MSRLSIITVNLNNAKGLQKTIESVISQTFTDYEYIIIDGGSTDGSKEIIKKYADKVNYWVSEPDKGIYNGMNKGIKVAKGEYCLFLNSGDWLIDNNRLNKIFANNYKEDIIYGNIKNQNEDSNLPSKLTLKLFIEDSIAHPASFIKRELFLKYGFYNEQLKIVADWAFFIDVIIRHNCTIKYINIVVCYMEPDGISNKKEFQKIHLEERNYVLNKLFPRILDDYHYFAKKTNNLRYYEKSKLVKIVKKTQKSKLYKFLRK